MALPDLDTLPEWYELCYRYRFGDEELGLNGITCFAIEALGITPTHQQDDLFQSVAIPGSRTSVASGHGCFGKGTMVRLYNGSTKPIEDMDADDVLVNGDGYTPVEILNIVKGVERMYRFGYDDGSWHEFNASHILCLRLSRHWGWDKAGTTIRVTVRDYLRWPARKRRAWCIYRLTTPVGCKKPQYQLHKIKSIQHIGEQQYHGVVVEEVHGANTFLLADGTVVHNTGKTASAGIVALWHLLFFPDSVMMFTAPQINQLRKLVWKEITLSLTRLKQGPLAWLADYVVVLAEMVYIKGRDKTWHVLAKTASKHQPTNIAGQHGDNYFLWIDEACGVDDAIIEVAMGALTHEDNRCCMTSQPARNAGFFHATHHRLSYKVGGVWTSLVFNGEESPLVSEKTIHEMLEKYGSRDDYGYMIRVRGLFPDRADEFLVTVRQAAEMYVGKCLFDETHDDYGYIISVDVGGGVGRDDSVIAVARVWGEAQWGERARRVEIVEIPLCKNRDDLHELTAIIDEMMNKYPNTSLVLDANGAGRGLAQNLKSKGIFFKSVYWGGACFSNANREEYANKRSQAIVCLSRAIKMGRFKILTTQYKMKVEEQVTRLPYFFDDMSRFKVPSKEDFRKIGLRSPDIADVFAFLFLEGVNYTEANEFVEQGSRYSEKEKEIWDELDSVDV